MVGFRFRHNPLPRKLRRFRRKPILVAGLIVLGLILSRFPQVADLFRPALPSEGPSEGIVARVIDGDTVELEDGRRVRLIGIDTPETRHSPRAEVEGEDDPLAREATEYLRQRAEGRRVRLEYGPEPEDEHGRTLAYLHLEDGTDLNAELLRRGLARALLRFAHPRMAEYLALEEDARAERLGLWAE